LCSEQVSLCTVPIFYITNCNLGTQPTYLHHNEKIHDQYERCQERPRQFIGGQEVAIQLVPVNIVGGDDEHDCERCQGRNNPEKDDAVVATAPPLPYGARPARVQLLLQHDVRHLAGEIKHDTNTA